MVSPGGEKSGFLKAAQVSVMLASGFFCAAVKRRGADDRDLTSMLAANKFPRHVAIRQIVQPLLFFMVLLTTCGTALAKGPKGKQPSNDVCRYVLEAANQNRLGSILVPSEPYESTMVKFPGATNTDLGIFDYGSVIFKQHLDINNDGKPERVFVTSEGSLHIKQLYIFHAKKDTTIELHNEANEEPEQWESDIDFVNFRGTTYLVARNDLSLAYVAYIDPTNKMRSVCRYGQEEESFRKIISSREKELCDRYLDEEPQSVEYDKPHSVDDEILAAGGMYSVSPGEEAALLDINNDGSPRLVVSLEELTSNFCGSLEYPAVLTPDGTGIDPAFAKFLPARECRASIFPFVDHGNTYLGTAEYRSSDDAELKLRKIDMLERGVLKPLCEYEVRPVNYLLTPEQELEQTAAARNSDLWSVAISRPGTAAVETLIKAGRNLNEKDRDTGRELPLISAIMAGRLDILELLLKAGANPDLPGNTAENPLQEAIRRNSHKAIEMLLRYGADPSDESRGNHTAIASAVYLGDLASLRQLLEAGGAITGTAAIDVVHSREADRHDKLRLLLSFGLDPDRQYARPEFAAGIKEESPGILTLGPNITTRLASKTLMEWAAESGDAETGKILAEAQKRGLRGGLVQQIRMADDELNRTYKLLTAVADKSSLTALKAQQRAWVKERDKRCGSTMNTKFRVDWLRNAAAQEQRGRCVLDATRRRTDELTQRLIPELYLPKQAVAGRSQSDWSQEYWRWSKFYPKGKGPSDDPSGAFCAQGQAEPIWFLTGSSNNKPVRRQCTIPAGRPIFFPVLASHAEALSTEATCSMLQGMLNSHTLGTRKMQVVLDGKQLPDILPRWRQSTDCFMLIKADGEHLAASDGYWLALKPLLPGRHAIKFSGEMEQDGFSQDVYYDLLVQ